MLGFCHWRQIERVIVTHGQEAVMVRWLREQGLDAGAFRTEYGGEGGELPAPLPAQTAAPAGPGDAAVDTGGS